jgi:predicted amidohydrolase YtcJ
VTPPLLFRRVELADRSVRSVLVLDGRIAAIDTVLTHPGALEIDGAGGALLPGLNDHHLHLFALAAAEESVLCGPDRAPTAEQLAAVLRDAAATKAPGEWVRAIGYDEQTAGRLTARVLDLMLGDLADRAVRLQHRSGHAWILNSTAVRVLGRGPADGVLLEADDAVRTAGDPTFPSLVGVSARLASYGVTGVSDAGVFNGPAELTEFRRASAAGELLQRCQVLGTSELGPADEPEQQAGRPLAREAVSTVTVGQEKIVLAEHDLPALSDLVAQIEAAGSRGVAIHAVSSECVVLACTALLESGRSGQRLEHASVAPPDVVALAKRAGARVITQPAFIHAHGDRYLRTVDSTDLPWLYRLGGWLAAGVPIAAGSDAPYGPTDPWLAMKAAASRRTSGGALLSTAEKLRPEQALAMFTGPLSQPAGFGPMLRVGDVADLCLLRVGWSAAMADPTAELVGGAFVAGTPVWFPAT